jgi:transposase
MPQPPTSRTQVLDHRGLVAGMFDEPGIGAIIDRATQQNPEMHMVTAGHAVNAMVLNGLGFVNQSLDLVPQFFQHKPTSRLIDPEIAPEHLNAATAAERLGLAPPFAPLESTSFHVDGRYNSNEAPDEQVVHITRGYSRDHRPDLNQVMLELIVEHQAGIPVLMKPLSGNSSDAPAFGQTVHEHIEQLHTTDGTPYLVADSTLYSEDNLQKLANTHMKWITRVPATLHDAQAALTQAAPQAMMPLTEGCRSQVLISTYGGVEQRWVLIYSESRQPQARRAVATQLLKQSAQEVKAFKQRCGTAFACEADAQQALTTFEQGLQATCLHEITICPTPRYGQRGRPGQGAPPAQVIYHIAGALASRLAAHQALIERQSCFILATNELDNTHLPPQKLLEGYKGQVHAERGFRFLKDPCFPASSDYLKKPERMMALFMVMTVCLLVYAALEYRIRKVLKDQGATFPNHKGQPVQNPTARWVFYDLGGFICCSSLNNGPWCSI